jgi:hypothetical protein
MNPDVERLAARQAGLVSRRQLRALGVDKNRVRNQLTARRWAAHGPLVVCLTTGPLSWRQKVWLGVLHAGPRCAVAGLTGLRMHGLRGWERGTVTVLVPQVLDVPRLPGIEFRRTRRDMAPFLWQQRGALCLVEPTALLHAAYQGTERAATGLLAAVVQQRLTTPAALAPWVDRMQPIRRARLFRRTLGEIEGGAESAAEIDVGKVCRRFGLPLPTRQVRRRDGAGGTRYTDCEWTLRDGRRVVLEVDGAFHMDVLHWQDDIARERALVATGVLVVRCTAAELRTDPAAVVRDLRALGVGRAVRRAL